MEERRKHRRLTIKETTTIQKADSRAPCLLVDISPGGMKALLDSDVKVGDTVSGQLKILPNAGPFYVKGTITWVRPLKEPTADANFEIGVKFTNINTIPF